jgi:hypothetical protein
MKDETTHARLPARSRGTNGTTLGTVACIAVGIALTLAIATRTRIASAQAFAVGPTALQDTVVSFARDVFPIIQRTCVRCHGAEDEAGEQVIEEGLNMLTYDGLMAGSLYGKVIEPGNAEESYLVELVAAGDMPKEGDPLPPEEIELIKRWITAGAPNN